MNTSNLNLKISVWVALCMLALSAPASGKKETTTVRVNKSERLAPSGAAEYCTALVTGQVVRYRFEAGAPLEFTIGIQHPDGGGAEPTIRQTAMQEIEYVDFKAQQPGHWCWRWANRGATYTQLRYTLFVAPPRRTRHK